MEQEGKPAPVTLEVQDVVHYVKQEIKTEGEE